MKRAIPFIAVLLAASAVSAHDHAETRIFVIRSQLAQAGPKPIVFAGDSVTEAALLPSEICGHRVVNAGIGGATTYSYALAARRFGDFSASAILVAIGTNDSTPGDPSEFPDRYRFLAKTLRSHSDVVLYAGMPPLERGQLSEQFDKKSSDAIEQAIREYAGSGYINIRAALSQTERSTIDGVHLSLEAQSTWLRTVLSRLRTAIGCG